MTTVQKIFLAGFVLLHVVVGVWLLMAGGSAEEKNYTKGNIEVFVREGCTHCADLEEYFERNSISANYIDISNEREKFLQVAGDFDLFAGTPITLSGETLFAGYDDDTTGAKILLASKTAEQQYSFDEALQNPEKISTALEASATCADPESTDANEEGDCTIPVKIITVPWYGEVKIEEVSTATKYGISFAIGFLDGFNPCAMWVLIVFILALMQIGDKVKMAFVAGTFLIAEAVMYGLILVLWWQFFGTLSAWGFDTWMQIIVGAIAVGAGVFFLYEGFFTDGTCQVTDGEQRKKISDKISDIASSPVSWAMFFAILVIAFSVNVIEFACSAGYPQVFTTQILSAPTTDFIDQVGFLLTYLGAYMLDDLIVFGIALFAIEKLGVMQQYGKGFNIFGGAVMLLIGELMIFFPEILKAVL